MAGGLRFRPESTLITSGSTPYAAGTKILVPTSQVTGIQRVGVYKAIIEAITAATFQFQDTSGTVLSSIFSLGSLGFFIIDTPINGDPWWQTGGGGVGLQLVTTGGNVAADIYIGFGA